MANVKAVIQYDGTDYCGFQRQPSVPTVAGELERVLGVLFGERTRVIGAGRTDAGVHALGQAINFEAPGHFPVDRICPAANGALPASIRLMSAEEVEPGFHARYSAKARTYRYVVLNREQPSALLTRYTWHLTAPLDVDMMTVGAARLTGIHDFASFGVPEKPGGSTVRQVTDLTVIRNRDTVVLTIRGNAFLRGMVRAIMGTLAEVGQGKRPPEEVRGVLEARDRQASGASAPPQGLYLVRVEY